MPETIPDAVKEIYGRTAGIAGWMAGAGPIFVGTKMAASTIPGIRPAFQHILAGMTAGAATGGGDKDQILLNTVLFGVLEPLAYGVPGGTKAVKDIAKSVRDSKWWRTTVIRNKAKYLSELDRRIEAGDMTLAEAIKESEAMRARETTIRMGEERPEPTYKEPIQPVSGKLPIKEGEFAPKEAEMPPEKPVTPFVEEGKGKPLAPEKETPPREAEIKKVGKKEAQEEIIGKTIAEGLKAKGLKIQYETEDPLLNKHLFSVTEKGKESSFSAKTAEEAEIKYNKIIEAYKAEAPEPLIEEAKKYKTAEDFVEGQGEYVRYANDPSGRAVDSKAGYQMFVERSGEDSVRSYGEHRVITDSKNAVSSYDIEADVAEMFKKHPDILQEYQATAEALASEVSPERIATNDAGIWDQPTLAHLIWEEVLEPKGITKVQTPDGMIVFDPSQIKTKSQLTDIWNKAHKAKPEAPKPVIAKPAKEIPPVIEEKPPPEGYADVGGYATLERAVIQMPEVVKIANALLKGKYPSVKKALRRKMAAGLFYPKGTGRIELKAEIFKNSDEAAAILSHEIGHLVDWLPEGTLSRGNILGRIAVLKKYMKHTLPRAPGMPGELTQKDRDRIRRIAEKLVKAESANKWVDEEIKKELPISSEDVLAIWNAVEKAKLLNPELYDYILMLNTLEKKNIVKEALKGQVHEQLKRFAKVVTEKTGKKIPVEITKETIARKYAGLINKELKKRRLFNLDEVTNELRALSREWKPFDPAANPKFTKYRYQSTELYADAFSALINAPGLLKAKAPLFYEGFFNYLERKPQVKKLYDEIQDDIRSGEVEQKRVKDIREMFRRGDDAYALSLERPPVKDFIARDMIDANWFLLKKVKQIGERNIPAGKNPRYKLEEMAYSGGEAEWFLRELWIKVSNPLEKSGLSWDDFGEYLFHKRISTERAEMANPMGWTPNLSKARLKEIQSLFTKEQIKILNVAEQSFRKTHQYVIDKGTEANMWDDDLAKKLRDADNYATFDVIKYIEERHGRGPSAKIFPQIGTLNEISNPVTATIMKDLALIKSISRKKAAESVVSFLNDYFPDEIKEADRKWNGRFHEVKSPRAGSRQGLLVYLDKGKVKGYYIDKYIAEIFGANPIEDQIIARMLGATVQPFRMAFVELNYGFWMFNIFRDYWRASKMLPRASISKFLPFYGKGIKSGFKSVFDVPDKVADEMLKGNTLISVADIRGLRPEDKQVERLLRMYHIQPLKFQNKIIKPFGMFFTYFTNVGRGFERATKIGSYLYLKKTFPEMPSEVIGHIVRARGGSPDFLRLGRGYPIYNNILLFSNAIKEGYRGDYEALSHTPSEFIWKQAKYTYIPKLLMYAASIGLLGLGTKKIFDGMSEYDKTNYICIPFGLTESGKSVYLRVPLDETSRFMGGIFWKILNHEKLNWGDVATGLFDYMAGQAPTIHPGVELLAGVIQYASGLNPYDHFKGRYAIPEQIFEAKDMRSHEAFLKWIAAKSGASIVYKFKYDDVDRVKSELEEVLDFPFASNILGRFLKVSDQGIREHLREVKGEIKKENVRELLDAKDAINKIIRGEHLTKEDVIALIKKPDVFDRNMMVGLARKHGEVYLQEFMTATSNKEKEAVIGELLKKENLLPGD